MISCPNCRHMFEPELPPSLAEVADFKTKLPSEEHWDKQYRAQLEREKASQPLNLNLNPQTFVIEGTTETR